MENKLAQEYKADLYNKVLEKRNIRNKRRKQCLTFCIVFIMFIGITGLGFSKFKKEDYKNFFKSDTENIMLNDEYEYFDDLGIKLEFINVDKNSITLGINIKYENIAEYYVDISELEIYDNNKNRILKFSNNILKDEMTGFSFDKEYENKNEIKFLISIENSINKIYLNINEIIFRNIKNEEVKNIKINYSKEISIGS